MNLKLYHGSMVLAAVVALCAGRVAAARGEDRLHVSQLKDGSEIHAAFREAVRQTSRSTVAVLVNGRQVSLGVIVGSDGEILTKASELAEKVRCRLRDAREFDAAIIGVHDRYDVALLKVEARGLPVVKWTDGHDPRVGQWAATPGMTDEPVAVGIFSVPRRPIPPERGVFGVQLSDGSPGAKVTHVVPESAAARAGMQAGDVIVRAGDQQVADQQSFEHLIHKLAPGDSVKVVIRRQKQEITLKTILGRPAGNLLTRGYWMNRMSGRMSQRRAGFPQAIQHDTVLDPESCGGAVVDLSGRAVGLNIARAGRVETYAIPADVAQTLVKELRAHSSGPADTKAAARSAAEIDARVAPLIPPSPVVSPAR